MYGDKMKKKTNILLIIIIIVLLLACCFVGNKLYKENQIKQMRNDSIASIESAVNLEDYRDKEKSIVIKYIDSGKEVINSSREKSEMDAAVEDTLKSISKVKTKEIIEKEKKIKEEKERKKKEAEARAAAEAQAQNNQNNSSISGSKGCVGSGAENFY